MEKIGPRKDKIDDECWTLRDVPRVVWDGGSVFSCTTEIYCSCREWSDVRRRVVCKGLVFMGDTANAKDVCSVELTVDHDDDP